MKKKLGGWCNYKEIIRVLYKYINSVKRDAIYKFVVSKKFSGEVETASPYNKYADFTHKLECKY